LLFRNYVSVASTLCGRRREEKGKDEQGRHLGVLKQVPKHTLKKQQVFKKKQ